MRIYALRTYFADGVLGQWAVRLPNHTARERELLTLFTSGHPYARTAKAKGLSPVTIRNTISRVQDKLGLVIWAMKNGLAEELEMRD